MTYREAIKDQMVRLSILGNTRFVGYNLLYGHKGYGTLEGVDKNKIMEMPVAENLMAGIATGLALAKMRPVLIFERHDFMWLALDQLLNHLDKISTLSGGEFNPKVIVRAIAGSKTPLDPGLQHTGNYLDVFKKLFKFPVIDVKTIDDIKLFTQEHDSSIMFVEQRELYDTQL